MRTIIIAALGLAPLALLAGCQSEASALAELRTELLEQCNSGIRAKGATEPGFDAGRFCNCLVDKTMKGKSLDELAKSENKAEAMGVQAGMECRDEQMNAGAAPGAAPAAPTAQTPPTEPQAQETGAETAKEAADEAE